MRDLLIERWSQAAGDLGIEVETPVCLQLESGARIHGRLLVRNFGAPNGMIIVTDYSTVRSVGDQLVAAGFGFSTLSEPSESERYDRDSFIALLRDWGWSGPQALRPAWCIPLEQDEDPNRR